MILNAEMDGKELTITLLGDLNISTAPRLADIIDSKIDDITSLVLDFAECDYVSSAGLRVLLSTYKTLKKNLGTMRLLNVGEGFKDVLECTALDAVFDIEYRPDVIE